MTEDRSIDELHTHTLGEIDGMIFGRKAHATIADFWKAAAVQTNASPDLAKQAERMTALPKYVVTHGEERTAWINSRAITPSDVPRLKAEALRPIAVFAGSAAIQALLDGEFIDELRLIRYPIVLGGGTPLFAADGKRCCFELIDLERFGSGAVLERFRVTN